MNTVDPEAYLGKVLAKIVARDPISRVDELLPFASAKPVADKTRGPKRDAFASNRHPALGYRLRMTPAFAGAGLSRNTGPSRSFMTIAHPLFGIML